MSVSVHIEGKDATEVRQTMIALLGTGMHEAVRVVDALPDPPKEKASKKREETKAAAPPAESSVKRDEPPVSPYQPVREIIAKLVEVKGRDKTIALLREFNAKVGSELKETEIPAFLLKAQALVAE
jgi:hypothetical protein